MGIKVSDPQNVSLIAEPPHPTPTGLGASPGTNPAPVVPSHGLTRVVCSIPFLACQTDTGSPLTVE